jgi:hypothetical protein
MCLVIPGVADAADSFAEADGEVHDGLKALRLGEGEAVAVSEQHFGIAEDSGERVIDFVAKHLADILGTFAPRGTKREIGDFSPPEPAFEQRGSERNVIAGTHHEVGLTAGDQTGDFQLPLPGCQQDDGSDGGEVPDCFVERRGAKKLVVE